MHSSDARLVEAALRREPGGVRALVAHLAPVIRYQVARVLLSDPYGSPARNLPSEVDDMFQEVLLQLFSNDARDLRRWKAESALRTYVACIARRRTRALLKARCSNPWYLEPAEAERAERLISQEPDAERVLVARQVLQRAFHNTMEGLSSLGVQVARHLFCQELSASETARRVGLSTDAVYQWKSRIARSLRQQVDALEHEQSAGGAS